MGYLHDTSFAPKNQEIGAFEIKEFFGKTFSELTTEEPLDIRGLGESPLTVNQLSGLFAVVSYRYENMLPTTTYISMASDVLKAALCKARDVEGDMLAYAIVGRLWEMGVVRTTAPARRAAVASTQAWKEGDAVFRRPLYPAHIMGYDGCTLLDYHERTV